MTETVTGSSVDAGRTGPDSPPPDSTPLNSGSAILRFVERYKRASGTSPTVTAPLPALGEDDQF